MPAPASSWPVSQVLPGLAGRATTLSLNAGPDLGDLADALLRIEPVARQLELRGLPPGPGEHEAPALHAWLAQLADAVADAEDLLDDLLCRRRGPAFSSCVGLPNRPACELQRLVARIYRALEDSERLRAGRGRVAAGCGVRSPNRVTGSFLAERSVVGRHKECEDVVGALLGDHLEEKRSSSAPVTALVGHGGMGKTTVAQYVYNDARVEAHFDLRAWVCVWDRSDEAELTREILQSIGGAGEPLGSDDDGLANLERLQEKLEESVASKRFLLVLDDVWIDESKTQQENRAAWNKVLAPLSSAGSGSKILVTSRMKLVAEVLNVKTVVPIDGLRSCDCWLLFKEAALGVEIMDCPPYLQEIGRAISAKLKGSPLAAKALGQMLRNTSSLHKWRVMLDKEICEDIIIQSLQLSYLHLPGHLQRCFAYCSIFPRSWRFSRHVLVRMWVALGFILPPVEGKQLEDLGLEYFDDLLSRSFFQAVNKVQQTYYVLDDMMYELAQHFSAHDCVKVEEEIPVVVPHMVRHMSVSTDYLPQFKKSTYKLGRVQTLVVHRGSGSSSSHVPSKVLARFKRLRVLDLSWSDIAELPGSVCELVHLRYLALCCKTTKMPKCIYKLRHLEVLDMPLSIHDNDPGGISKFVTLKHLGTCYRHKVDEGHDWCLRVCLRVDFRFVGDSFVGMGCVMKLIG